MKSPLSVSVALATGLALLPAAAGWAQSSLNDARSAVRKGTTEGIVLIPARKPAEPPAAGASAPAAGGTSTPVAGGASAPLAAGAKASTGSSTTGSTTSSAAPAAPAAKTSVLGGLLDNIRLTSPPSGQPLQAAKRDDSAARGIPVPTAASASRPASAPR